MRNDRPDGRREKGGDTARAYLKPVNFGKARRALRPDAVIVLELGEHTYRRLTPANAERVARELLAAAEEARKQLEPERSPS